MRYFVSFQTPNSHEHIVEISRSSNGNFNVLQDQYSTSADIIALGNNTYSVILNGHVFDLVLQEQGSGLHAIVNGQAISVRVENEQTHTTALWQQKSGSTQERIIKAPMPGRIVKICVALGEVVQAGQPLVVMEAMKMENELRAKSQGKIAEIHVNVGSAVEMGARIVTFE